MNKFFLCIIFLASFICQPVLAQWTTYFTENSTRKTGLIDTQTKLESRAGKPNEAWGVIREYHRSSGKYTREWDFHADCDNFKITEYVKPGTPPDRLLFHRGYWVAEEDYSLWEKLRSPSMPPHLLKLFLKDLESDPLSEKTNKLFSLACSTLERY